MFRHLQKLGTASSDDGEIEKLPVLSVPPGAGINNNAEFLC